LPALAVHDTAPTEATDRPGEARASSDRSAGGKPHLEEPQQYIIQQRFLTTEEMRASGNVEKQAIFPVDRHQRRIAIAPVRDSLQKSVVGPEVFFHHVQLWVGGPCLRQALATSKACLSGQFIESG